MKQALRFTIIAGLAMGLFLAGCQSASEPQNDGANADDSSAAPPASSGCSSGCSMKTDGAAKPACADCQCSTGNCKMADGKCANGKCKLADGKCADGKCKMADGKCADGKCKMADGMKANEDNANVIAQ